MRSSLAIRKVPLVNTNLVVSVSILTHASHLYQSPSHLENNIKKVNLAYTRTNNVIHILQKRPNLPHPSLLFRQPSSVPSRDRLVPRRYISAKN
jgi:hypothetical protein